MNAARTLRWARLTAGLSQQALAAKTGVPQSTIGRIEAGKTDPRSSTLVKLLHACGFDLEVEQMRGQGVDRSPIRGLLALSPTERIARLKGEARVLKALAEAARKGPLVVREGEQRK